MKVLTAAEMREVDRLTIASGTPEATLMERAGRAVADLVLEKFSPIRAHRVLVLCGKGNNGGDGLVAARLLQEYKPRALWIVQSAAAEQSITTEMREATVVVDALLGTGLRGPARGRAAELIREINNSFPRAKVVSVDIPSGMNSDSGRSEGEHVMADYTVTFTAPKIAHVLPPNCDDIGEWRVADIGSPRELYSGSLLNLTEPVDFAHLLRPRELNSNKGKYGHVLVVGGAAGKTGAAEMAGLAALRAGAGLATVASAAPELRTLELMKEGFPHDETALLKIAAKKNVVALGPGLGSGSSEISLARAAVERCDQTMVIDADGLNALAGIRWHAGGRTRVLTPHPGEMSRLCGRPIAEVQASRLSVARDFAARHGATLVLKGHRTLIAFPGGSAWVNPVDTPALAKGGTGDILTGLIAGLLAQFPHDAQAAVLGAVYLHGRAGQLASARLGEMCVIATDLLSHLGEAMRECSPVPHPQ